MRNFLLFPFLIFAGCSSLQRTDHYALAHQPTTQDADDESYCVEVEHKGRKYELAPLRASHFVAIGIPFIPLLPAPISHRDFSLKITPLTKGDSSTIHPQRWALRIGERLIPPSSAQAQSGKVESDKLSLTGAGMEVWLSFPSQKESFDKFTLVTEWKDQTGKPIEIELAHKFGSLEYHPFSLMSYQLKCATTKI